MNQHSVTKALLAVALIFPGLALGAVHPMVLAVFLILGAGLFAYLSFPQKRTEKLQADLPSLILLILIGFTTFQLIPLPSAIVSFLSPAAYDLRTGALEPLGLEAPTFMPLTLDATFTIVELGKLCLYLAVYWAALVCTKRHGSEYVLSIVVVAGALAAFVLLAHKILMLDSIYGFYEPLHLGPRGERISAPLINENHMAAFLGLSGAVAIGWAIDTPDRSKRILSVFVAALIGGSLLLTLSRGGIAAFIAGQFLFVLLRILERFRTSKDVNNNSQLGWIPLGLALSLGLGLFAAQDAIIGEFVTGDHKKIEMLSQGLPLVKQFPATGVGRGAFWVAFPLVSEWASTITYTHAENAVVQLLVDYGVLFGAAALLGFGFTIAKLLLHPPRRVRNSAALAALVAFGVHNLVDFNMEIPGVAVLAAALLGSLIASDKKSRFRPKLSSFTIRNGALYGLVVLTLATAGLVGFYSESYNVDKEELALRAVVGSHDKNKFEEESLRKLLVRHPSDWYLPFLVGVHKFHTGTGNPMPWLGRALDLNQSSASAHFYVGRVLLRTGHLNQAMLEFRLASRKNAGLSSHIARLLIQRENNFEKLRKIAADDDDKRLLWSALALELSKLDMDKEAEEIDLELIALKPSEPRSLARQARRISKLGNSKEALELAEQLERFLDFNISGSLLRAEILQRDNQFNEAVNILESSISANGQDAQLLHHLAWAKQKNGDHTGAINTARSIMSQSTGISKRVSAVTLQGDIERADGNVHAALSSYREAHALDPGSIGLLKKIANLAENLGDKTRALDALRKLTNLDPASEEWKHRLELIENQIRSNE